MVGWKHGSPLIQPSFQRRDGDGRLRPLCLTIKAEKQCGSPEPQVPPNLGLRFALLVGALGYSRLALRAVRDRAASPKATLLESRLDHRRDPVAYACPHVAENQHAPAAA